MESKSKEMSRHTQWGSSYQKDSMTSVAKNVEKLEPLCPAGGGLVTKSCPTLCNPMDYKPPGSSVHGILQARIL